jgi:hypothetical protein
VVARPEYVVVRRYEHSFPGLLVEWRQRDDDQPSRRSASVIFLDADKILRQSWFPETCVEPAPSSAA